MYMCRDLNRPNQSAAVLSLPFCFSSLPIERARLIKIGQKSANHVITRSKTKSDELQLIRADPFGKARCSIRSRLWQGIACTTAPNCDDGRRWMDLSDYNCVLIKTWQVICAA